MSMKFSALVVLATPLAAAAQGLLGHMPVDAPVGLLHGTGSGTNFLTWDVQGGTGYQVLNRGLGFPGLATSGRAAVGGGSYFSSGIGLRIPAPWDPPNEWVPYRTEDSPNNYAAGKDGTTVWGSMLLNNFVDSNDYTVSLHDSGIRWFEGNTSVRLRPVNGIWHLEQRNGPSVSTGVSLVPGKTTFMVLKMEFHGPTSDRVTLYVDPAPGQSAPNTPGTVLNTTGSFQFRSAGFYPGNGALQGAVDEIRFGAGYADVGPAGPGQPASDFDPFRVYFLGNSVTDTINQEALRVMSLETGHAMPWGRHMIPGTPLEFLWNSPNGGFTQSPYNYYPTALPNWHWNAVSIQPFDRQLASDLDYSRRFIDLAKTNPLNADTEFYIYSRWPRKNDDGTLDFQAKWDRAYTGGGGTEESRAYFEQLVQQLRAAYPGAAKPVLMTPVGDVLYELDRRMEQGLIPGYSDIAQVYSDGIHFNSVGSYITGLTYYATMFRDDPRWLTGDPYGINNPALAALLKEAVWDVVAGHAYSGVVAGDFSRDGKVDVTDLGILATHWQQAVGAYVLGDTNFDGMVDVSDLGTVASHWLVGVTGPVAAGSFEAAFAAALASVPEPASAALLLGGAMALRRRR